MAATGAGIAFLSDHIVFRKGFGHPLAQHLFDIVIHLGHRITQVVRLRAGLVANRQCAPQRRADPRTCQRGELHRLFLYRHKHLCGQSGHLNLLRRVRSHSGVPAGTDVLPQDGR